MYKRVTILCALLALVVEIVQARGNVHPSPPRNGEPTAHRNQNRKLSYVADEDEKVSQNPAAPKVNLLMAPAPGAGASVGDRMQRPAGVPQQLMAPETGASLGDRMAHAENTVNPHFAQGPSIGDRMAHAENTVNPLFAQGPSIGDRMAHAENTVNPLFAQGPSIGDRMHRPAGVPQQLIAPEAGATLGDRMAQPLNNAGNRLNSGAAAGDRMTRPAPETLPRPLYSVNPLGDGANKVNPLNRPLPTRPLEGLGNEPSQLPSGPSGALLGQLMTLQMDIGRLRRLLYGGHLTYEGLLQNLDILQTDLGVLELELFNLKREGLLSTSIHLPGFDAISFNIGAVLNRESGRVTHYGMQGLENSAGGIGSNILSNVGELSQLDVENLKLEALRAKANAGFGDNVLLPGGVPIAPPGGMGNVGLPNVGDGISGGVDFAKDKIGSGLGGGLGGGFGLNSPLVGLQPGEGLLGGMENTGDKLGDGLSDIAARLAESNLDGTFESLSSSLLSVTTADEGSTKKYMRQGIAHAVELRNILYDQDWNMDYPAVDSSIKSLDELIETLKQAAWNEVDMSDPIAVEAFVHDLNSRVHTVGWDIQRISEEFSLQIPTSSLRNYMYTVNKPQPRTASNLRRQ